MNEKKGEGAAPDGFCPALVQNGMNPASSLILE